MGTITQAITNARKVLSQLSAVGAVMLMRKYGTTNATDGDDTENLSPLKEGENGGLAVEFQAGATAPLPTGAATSAKQDSIIELFASPPLHTSITPNDSTDLTALANIGVIVGGAGELAYRCAGAPTTTVTIDVVAGQFIPGQFTRVMAGTTVTDSIVGLART
jgi:hypothetical protein